MLAAAVLLALALLVVAVSWGREIDDTVHDAAHAVGSPAPASPAPRTGPRSGPPVGRGRPLV